MYYRIFGELPGYPPDRRSCSPGTRRLEISSSVKTDPHMLFPTVEEARAAIPQPATQMPSNDEYQFFVVELWKGPDPS